ncbi:MAG TPA: cytochrome c [Gammaproteobacteria bacterium]|nr:cytochrome c [Gammaproteobacteria bacterium]
MAVLFFMATGPAGAANMEKGRQIYVRHCQQCHGARGQGQIPGAPDFARGERLLQPDVRLAESIRNGKGVMPAYRALLKDEDLLDVIAYLRTLRR